jgi:hypothetical protein
MRHNIRWNNYPHIYTKKECRNPEFDFTHDAYIATKNNLKDCNQIYKDYMKEKKTKDRINGL